MQTFLFIGNVFLLLIGIGCLIYAGVQFYKRL